VKILAVEDDPVARAVLRLALRRLGHEVLEVEDGESAWKLLGASHDIRIVVSDWVMPRSDGLELCRRIRERAASDYVYFILVTSRDATQENRMEAADAGVDDFLIKPLDVSELWTRLRVAQRILGYTRQVRELQELMPICAYCKKIRDDHNYWQQLEGFISERTGVDFSHSVCPDCYTRVLAPQLETMKQAAAPKKVPTVARKHPKT
jgi:DNA-binding response OmpR family regulator